MTPEEQKKQGIMARMLRAVGIGKAPPEPTPAPAPAETEARKTLGLTGVSNRRRQLDEAEEAAK